MKRLVVLTVSIFVFLPTLAAAHDVFAPDWRGQEGTTYQEWRFDNDANPAAPDVIDNDYGSASGLITVGEYGTGWWYDMGLGTQTGMWDIGGDDGRIVLDIDNRPWAVGYKEIRVQVTYYKGISAAPTVSVQGAQFVSSQTVLVEEDTSLWGWYLDQSIWQIDPNPSHEQVILTGDYWGSVIDQVVVDTKSTPGCIVDFDDLEQFCEQWLQCGPDLKFDLDPSGCVDFKDFCIFANSWLDACPW